jgi:hypothetical protein
MSTDAHAELVRYRSEREWFQLLHSQVKDSDVPEHQLAEGTLSFCLDMYNRIIRCVEEDDPFVATYYCSAPEICTALDLPWYMVMQTPFLASSVPYLLDDIDSAEAMGLGADLCTAIRLSIYYIEANLSPIPSCIVGLLYPCDGAPMLHQVIKHNSKWRDIPMFNADPPYWDDDRSLDYFAAELRKMAKFLEQHTGRKLDMDKLKEAIEESNKQFALWQEYNELRRAVPSPHGWDLGGSQCFSVTQCYRAGQKGGTDWFRKLIEIAEHKVANKIGAVEKERIRLFWFDLLPFGWIFDLLPWLEQEWGAVMVMDMFGNYPYTLIDTSSEEQMWRDLAKRNLFDAPMIRQARGVADNFVNDIARIVKDYKIDVVIWPGHMGHKDGSATIGIMRETCRKLKVPFMSLGLDLFDRRYATPDQLKEKMSEFFRAMGLG